MKKIIALTLAIVMCFALLTSCGSKDNADKPADAQPSASQPADNQPANPDPAPVEDQDPPEKITLTFSSYLNEMAPTTAQYTVLQDKVNEILGGDYLTITLHANGTLAGATESLDALETGLCDMAVVSANYFESRLPICKLTEYPGLVFASPYSACAAVHEFLKEWDPAELEGVTLLTTLATGYGAFYTNKPIHSLADLAGLELRTPSSTISTVMQEWGITPVTIEFSEAYEAMRSGLVDGQYNNGAGALFNYDDVIDYFTYSPMFTATDMIMISDAALEKMPKVMQDALMEAADIVQQEHLVEFVSSLDSLKGPNERFLNNMSEITFLSDATIDEMNQAVSYMLDEYVAKLDADGLKGTEALALLQEKIAKYDAVYPATNVVDEYKAYAGDKIVVLE